MGCEGTTIAHGKCRREQGKSRIFAFALYGDDASNRYSARDTYVC